jgi:hypothetical protein
MDAVSPLKETPKTRTFFWKDRLRASGIHFCISLAVASLAALLVFLVWYPYPYREVSGGRELFLILVSVDVVLGPLITLMMLMIFNRSKPRRELVRDLAIVGLIQLSALAYGMWTVFVARPVHLAFEIDRFRVIHAVDVPVEMMEQAPPELQSLPLFGQSVLAVRPFRSAHRSIGRVAGNTAVGRQEFVLDCATGFVHRRRGWFPAAGFVLIPTSAKRR